jgi:hypothetical protein
MSDDIIHPPVDDEKRTITAKDEIDAELEETDISRKQENKSKIEMSSLFNNEENTEETQTKKKTVSTYNKNSEKTRSIFNSKTKQDSTPFKDGWQPNTKKETNMDFGLTSNKNKKETNRDLRLTTRKNKKETNRAFGLVSEIKTRKFKYIAPTTTEPRTHPRRMKRTHENNTDLLHGESTENKPARWGEGIRFNLLQPPKNPNEEPQETMFQKPHPIPEAEEEKNARKIKKRRLKIEHEKKICIMIQRIKNPLNYKNPILLENETKIAFPKAIRANLLRYGDIKVWFKNEEDAHEAAENYKTKKTFGAETVAHKWRRNDEQFVILNVSNTIEKSAIEEYWNKNQFPGMKINKEIKKQDNNHWKTLFVKPKNEEQCKKLIKDKHVLIGFARYKISPYRRREVPQCFKCQKLGHIAKICYAELKCRFCGQNHDSRNCQNKNQQKYCPRCKRNHANNMEICKKFLLDQRSNKFGQLQNEENPEIIEIQIPRTEEEKPEDIQSIWGLNTPKFHPRGRSTWNKPQNQTMTPTSPKKEEPKKEKKKPIRIQGPRTEDNTLKNTIHRIVEEAIKNYLQNNLKKMIEETIKEVLKDTLRSSIQESLCSN